MVFAGDIYDGEFFIESQVEFVSIARDGHANPYGIGGHERLFLAEAIEQPATDGGVIEIIRHIEPVFVVKRDDRRMV
ncbi:MAG: hypothetical protein V5A27_11520, partial [Halapricum sp.]